MPAVLRIDPVEVDHRLHDLGWTRDELIEVALTMVNARYSCTENDPVSAAGWMAWKEGTRRLREIGRQHGMVINNDDQVPWLIDESRKRRFSVANTDEGTANEFQIPQNRTRKGNATDKAIAENEGLLFLEAEITSLAPRISAISHHPEILVSWYLCVYCTPDGIAVELSCPTAMEGGFFLDFAERIFIAKLDGDLVTTLPDVDEPTEEFDVPVTKK